MATTRRQRHEARVHQQKKKKQKSSRRSYQDRVWKITFPKPGRRTIPREGDVIRVISWPPSHHRGNDKSRNSKKNHNSNNKKKSSPKPPLPAIDLQECDVPIFKAGTGALAEHLRSSSGYKNFYNVCVQLYLEFHGKIAPMRQVSPDDTVLSLIASRMGCEPRFLKHVPTNSNNNSGATKMKWELITNPSQKERICITRISNMRQRDQEVRQMVLTLSKQKNKKNGSHKKKKKKKKKNKNQEDTSEESAEETHDSPASGTKRARQPLTPSRKVHDHNTPQKRVRETPVQQASKQETVDPDKEPQDKENQVNGLALLAATAAEAYLGSGGKANEEQEEQEQELRTPPPSTTQHLNCMSHNRGGGLSRYPLTILERATTTTTDQDSCGYTTVLSTSVALPLGCDLAWCRDILQQEFFGNVREPRRTRSFGGCRSSPAVPRDKCSWKFVLGPWEGEAESERQPQETNTEDTKTPKELDMSTLVDTAVEPFWTLQRYLDSFPTDPKVVIFVVHPKDENLQQEEKADNKDEKSSVHSRPSPFASTQIGPNESEE